MGDEEVTLLDETTSKFFVNSEQVYDWRKYYLKEGHSIASTTTYFNYLKSFVGFGIEINQKNVDKFRLKSSAGASAGALKNFFNFLVKKKEFPMEIRNIYFDKSKSTKKFPEALDPLEVEKIIEAMGNVGLKEKIFTLVMANLGLRISECMKLKFEDFNWLSWMQDKEKQGSVNLKNTKGGKFRTIPVSKEIMQLLYNVSPNKTSEGIPMGKDSLLVFDFGFSEFANRKELSNDERVYAYLKYAADRYRIILNRVTQQLFKKKAHPHMFRHYKAQDLMNKGLNLSSLQFFLGHSSISSTQIYASSSAEMLKKDMEKLENG
jgi:integrase/recombinase XerD